MEGVTDLVGHGVSNLVWGSLLGPLCFLLHNLLDDLLSVTLTFLCVPDAGLEDWLQGFLESLLDCWGELLGAFVRLNVVLLVGAGALTLTLTSTVSTVGSWVVVEWVLSVLVALAAVLVAILVVVLLVLGLLLGVGVTSWVVGEISFVSQALAFLLLDLALDLTVNLALGAVVLVLALESIAGDESGSRAEGTVLGALHLADLLSVEVTAQTAGLVAESVGGIDGNVLAVGGNIKVVAEDLDTTVVHLFNVNDDLFAVLVADLSWQRFNTLSVDANLDLGFAQALFSLWGQLNLGLLSEEDGHFALVSSDVLGQNGDWVLFRAVLSQNMDATFSSLAGEAVGDVVEGVDVVALQLTSWLRFGAEKSVSNVLWDGLGGGDWKNSLEDAVGLDIFEGEARVGLDDFQAGEFSVWGDDEGNLSLSFSGTLVCAVVAHVWVEERFDNILNLVAGVSDFLWELREADLEKTLVKGSSLLFSNLNADWRHGESLLFVFLAFLCLA